MTARTVTAWRPVSDATWQFAVPVGVAAFLLFSVEPLIGRLVLPVFGGTPAVWATVLFFFQSVLLLGYLYAHVSVTRFGRLGPYVHLALAALALLALLTAPASLAGLRTEGSSPAINLVWILVGLIGLPAFVITATTPLLSGWLHAGRDDDQADPYWLYALSNAGSLAALLAYPLLIEPRIGLGTQRLLWAIGFAVLIGLVGLAALRALPEITRRPFGYFRAAELIGGSPAAPAIGWGRRGRWILLAAVPSGLLAAVTNFIATDLVSAPLLWVGPLALYLVSFIVAFSPRGGRVLRACATLTPAAVTLLWVPYGSAGGWPILVLLAVELIAFAVVAIGLHGRLAQDRPDPDHLTEFYLVISFGGAVAAAFVAIIAPSLFPDIWEYPILLVAALAALAVLAEPIQVRRAAKPESPPVTVRVSGAGSSALAWPDRAPAYRPSAQPPASAAATNAPAKVSRAGLGLTGLDFRPFLVGLSARFLPYGVVAVGLAGILLLTDSQATEAGVRWLLVGGLILAVGGRPWFLVVATAVVLVLASTVLRPGVEAQARSFFGVSQVIRADGLTRLMSGTTLHGTQWSDPARRRTPTSYYTNPGPVADIMAIGAHGMALDPKGVGVVGLGSGTLAAYKDSWTAMTFFEIDPVVIRIARDPRLFTYLADAPGMPDIVEGDARLSLADEPDARYDVLVLDAFSSDVIPVHLLTREAIAEEARVVAADGLIAFHVSNRYYDLAGPIVTALSEQGWIALERTTTAAEAALEPTAIVADWVVATRAADAVAAFRARGWTDAAPAERPFTDDYADLLSYLKLGP